ncbi:hypothetical protein B0H10DRAFT_2220585 [Mycena sp. CBHHK59/15]|nr:hypothetical protein B0H10DRAFT_2220585 [Mycena sp. CBHHK59/15]
MRLILCRIRLMFWTATCPASPPPHPVRRPAGRRHTKHPTPATAPPLPAPDSGHMPHPCPPSLPALQPQVPCHLIHLPTGAHLSALPPPQPQPHHCPAPTTTPHRPCPTVATRPTPAHPVHLPTAHRPCHNPCHRLHPTVATHPTSPLSLPSLPAGQLLVHPSAPHHNPTTTHAQQQPHTPPPLPCPSLPSLPARWLQVHPSMPHPAWTP